MDKVIQSQDEKIKADLNPQELVRFLLRDLTQRESDVIKARFGLEQASRATLDAIGKQLGITRERVRQIEKSALQKAKVAEGCQEKLSDLITLVSKNLSQHGNLRLEDSLFEDLIVTSGNEQVDKNCLLFLLSNFLDQYFEPLDIIYTDSAWKLKDKSHKFFENFVEHIKEIFNQSSNPLHLDDLVGEIKAKVDQQLIQELKEEVNDLSKALHSYLEVSKYFKKNIFDKWGLAGWHSVNPKRMRDKIYLVFQKDKKPLHYKRITERVNQENFDNKIAHTPTIHNELILDKRFVLIGRGIYAMVEWGYKPGSISEVIKEIMVQNGKPLSKDEIIREVLKRRIVKEGSINLAILDKTKYVRLEDGRFTLINQEKKDEC
ncbi:MAG: sigma factor-like helix-turn-helix DNA-binding protein [Candidatus Kuenenbacteria bacterium]